MKRGETVEGRARQKRHRGKIQSCVLTALFLTAGLGVAAVAPGSARLLSLLADGLGYKERLHRRLGQALSRLKDKGYVEDVGTRGDKRFHLTSKGRSVAEALLKEQSLIKDKRKWDGKWRIVMFDVWERRRSIRDRLRKMLRCQGFVKIQNSVWVYPYDREDLFVFMKTDLKAGKGMLYIVAEEIENDLWLRKHFKLPLE